MRTFTTKLKISLLIFQLKISVCMFPPGTRCGIPQKKESTCDLTTYLNFQNKISKIFGVWGKKKEEEGNK